MKRRYVKGQIVYIKSFIQTLLSYGVTPDMKSMVGQNHIIDDADYGYASVKIKGNWWKSEDLDPVIEKVKIKPIKFDITLLDI